LFVTYFPHLIAGPIIHHKDVIPQFERDEGKRPDPHLILCGLIIFAIGLFKKTLLADGIQPFVALAFGPEVPSFYLAWIGVLAYTFQLYFDFSGYSDMAIGISLMFGIFLPLNFNSPYKATSIIDFWRRWHMTLSRFLREYLYIPLGGNRHGTPRRYINLMATMLIGGLWHGAGWTFVAWGGLHGVYLVVNHAWRAVKIPLPRFPAAALTFLAVVVAWVFFRASDFATAASLLHAMAFGHGLSLPRSLPAWPAIDALGLHLDGAFHNDLFRADRAMLTVGVGLAAVWMLPNTQQLFSHLRPALSPADGREEPSWSRLVWRPSWRWGCAFGLLSAASFVALGGESPFLYFRF
jgi:D-alanyl-lipoteichoic acid acyltransferase DltB (MBOAT superfamily)